MLFTINKENNITKTTFISFCEISGCLYVTNAKPDNDAIIKGATI